MEGKGSVRETFDEGAQTVEFAFVIIPLLAFVFLIIDIGWMIFAKATLQEAVREGVRYGVTGQVMGGQAGVSSSVRQVVMQYAGGFIPSGNAQTDISVQFYSASTLSPVTGPASCAGGNVMTVSISGVSVNPLAAIVFSNTPLTLSATSSDVIESSPNGIVPSCN